MMSSLGRRLRWHPWSVQTRLLAHALRSGLWRSLSPAPRRVACEQHVLAWPTRLPERADAAAIVGWLRQRGIRVHEGGNAFYLPPQPGLESALGAVVERYPPGSGFKILRDFRGLEEAHYLHPHRQTRLRRRLIGTPRDQLIVANYLHRLALGPRVWDLCLLRAGGLPMPAFVVQHVEGTAPDAAECAAFLTRLRAALSSTELRITVPNWERNKDFRCPGCNHNLLRDAAGALTYIDFQNFTVRNPQRIAEASGDVAGSRGHADVRSRPGRAAEREAAEWFGAARDLLGRHGLDLHDRVVLQASCDTGLVLHHALAAGAWWGVGWERPAVAGEAQVLAVARGFTRLDIDAVHLDDPNDPGAAIPGWLRHRLRDAIVLLRGAPERRLSRAVASLPWRALVFGLDHQPPAAAEEHARSLLARGAHVAWRAGRHEGGSPEQRLFLLLRAPASASTLAGCR